MKTWLAAAAGLTLWPVALQAQRYEIRKDTAEGSQPVPLIVLADQTAGVEAAVAPGEGGELSSFRVRVGERWVETLYLARDYRPKEGWRGKAPFLWPATGRNFPKGVRPQGDDGGYVWGDRKYPMPIHGFVKSLAWKVDSQGAGASGARLKLSLRDSEETRRYYPFGFALAVEYVLRDGALEIDYDVAASRENGERMFFSLGNHITFRVPFLEGTDPADMRFSSPSSIELLKDPPGVPSGRSRSRSLAMPVRLGEFDARQAVSLTGYDVAKPYMSLTDPQGLAIHMSHWASSLPGQPVILFNVWGDHSQGYFSPEPWVGLQNSFNLRQGLVHLEPGGTYEWTIRLEPERIRR